MLQKFENAVQQFLGDAIGPLRSLGWETFLLFVTIVLIAFLLLTWIRRISWRWRKPTFSSRHVRKEHHNYADTLKLNLADMQSYLGTDAAETNVADQVSKKLNGHFVVTIVESSNNTVCTYREMRLQLGRRKGALADSEIQLPAKLLTELRLNNRHDDDDEDSSEVSGSYDVYIRKVNLFDIRHWLLHPEREIRIVIWVTLITTLLPLAKDLFFG